MSRSWTLLALALLIGFASPSARAATPQELEELGMLHVLQMAPAVCEWEDAGDGAKLDAKIEELEKRLGVTEEQIADLQEKAEAELQKPGSCDPKGLARALYDEAIK